MAIKIIQNTKGKTTSNPSVMGLSMSRTSISLSKAILDALKVREGDKIFVGYDDETQDVFICGIPITAKIGGGSTIIRNKDSYTCSRLKATPESVHGRFQIMENTSPADYYFGYPLYKLTQMESL